MTDLERNNPQGARDVYVRGLLAGTWTSTDSRRMLAMQDDPTTLLDLIKEANRDERISSALHEMIAGEEANYAPAPPRPWLDVVRSDGVARHDTAPAVGKGGHGYNPYRDKGKFAPGPHAKRPGEGARTAAKIDTAKAKVDRAKARVDKIGERLTGAKTARRAAVAKARETLTAARIAAATARKNPLVKNQRAAQVATNKAARAAAAVAKHSAAVTKHTEAHATARGAHAEAKAAHAAAKAAGGKAAPARATKSASTKAQVQESKPTTAETKKAAVVKPEVTAPHVETAPVTKPATHAPMTVEQSVMHHAQRSREAAEDGDTSTAQHHLDEANRLGGRLPGGFFTRDLEKHVFAAQHAISQFHGKHAVEAGALRSREYNEMADHFASKLSTEEKSAVHAYSNHADLIVNPALRQSGGRPDLSVPMYSGKNAGREVFRFEEDRRPASEITIGHQVRELDAAIAKNTLDRDVLAYRTLTDAGGHISGHLKVGSTFTDHAYVSTTANRNFIDAWAGNKADRVDMHITLKKGYTAAPMAKLSQFENEKELLGKRGTTFRVTKIVEATATSPKQLHVETMP